MILGIDIGATSIKVGVFAQDGHLRALAQRRNAPEPDPTGEDGWLIWNPDRIWADVCDCIRECVARVGGGDTIHALACTGFGTDGLPLNAAGNPCYPFISWHCGRTASQPKVLAQRVPDEQSFAITGYHNYAINTANRFLWLREHRPDVLDRAHRWLWMQDYVAFKLSGEFSTECTIASTSMLLDLGQRKWSKPMLEAARVDPRILPSVSEAGTQIGVVTQKAAEETGLRKGTPVVTGGHDCEIAVLGAGVNDAETWIDITGTWEILVATVNTFEPKPQHHADGLDFECHALPDQWICQSLMIAGAVTEWVRENFYRDADSGSVYETMFAEAKAASGGVFVLPSFMRGMGPDASKHAMGTILGLQTMTHRGQIVRATLEGLCYQLRKQIDAVGRAVASRPKRLRVVGGGQKNPLWLQLKADITGLPVEVTTHPEVTLLGVALLAGIGAGVYRDISDAQSQAQCAIECVEPSALEHDRYSEVFDRVYTQISTALAPVYGQISP